MTCVSRKRRQADKIFAAKKEPIFRCIVDGNWNHKLVKQAETKKNQMIVLGLSKSTQLGNLASNHSAEDEAPEAPKAFIFFLGVTGANIEDKSSDEQVNESKRCESMRTKAYRQSCILHDDQRV